MVDYSKEEQNIARLLLDGAKSIEELREKTGISAQDVNSALKKLVQLKLIERTEEDKYKLIKMIEKHIKGHSGNVEEKFKTLFIIEAVSKNKEALERQLEIMEIKLKTEKIKIIKMQRAETEESEEKYSSFIELEFYASEFRDVINMIISYGPSSIELLEPKKVELNLREAQDSLGAVMTAVHYYIELIMSLKHKELLEKQQESDD